jgi:uncharacterized membrane protein
MSTILANAKHAFLAGLAITAAILLIWLATAGADRIGLAAFLLRVVHVFAAMLWIGMVWFVNFIQLAALAEADDAGRSQILRTIVPRVAETFRHASHAVLATGALLLVTSGYILDRWLFASAVHVPTARGWLILVGVAGGISMWALVHFAIWPSLRIVLGEVAGDAAAKAAARERIRVCARLNLVLAAPVTFLMAAAAHLY